jgi:UDP-N-acetylglucosamine--N-acetylmuramyl-(pentapeptide) pyrophosphoryl-undecaprenol N-acetylglucosamine transferase
VQQRQLSILFAGGGTGGHLFPAIAIANEVRREIPESRITFVGTRHKIEGRVVPQNGFRFETIWVSGFRRKFTLENILFPLKVLVSTVQSFLLVWRLKPDVVVGTGGYVCGPPLFVASMLGIPTLIQEQNSYPGVTTRLLASRANEVHLSFANSRKYLKRQDNVRVSGNPIRENVGRISRSDGAACFGVDPDKHTLLVFGGSLGAGPINNAMLKVLPRVVVRDVQIVWQTGEMEFDRIRSEVDGMVELNHGVVKVYMFIDKIECAYAACDLAICRAGATTIAELMAAGVASILVPYPHAAADHQTENARAMVDGGASVMMKDSELDEKLLMTIEALFADKVQLQVMRRKASGMGNPGSAGVLARAILNLASVADGRA